MRKPSYKPMSKQQLAAYFGVSRKTMSVWINRMQRHIPDFRPNQRLFTPKQVKAIKKHLDG